MKNKRSKSEKSGSRRRRVELENTGALEERRTGFLPADGAYFFETRFEFTGSLSPTIVTCAAWLLEIFELSEGEIYFFEGGGKTIRPAAKNFGIFYPPFTVTRPQFENAKGRLRGFAGTFSLPREFISSPPASLLFNTTFAEPAETASVREILNSGEAFQPIEFNGKASLLSVRAKRLIDENYLYYPSIARIAARLNVTHAHLTRQFKLDFGMTPNDYFRLLRLADVPLKLAGGEKLVRVSQESGYNDLSRFYKQFRRTTRTSPGECRTLMKPAAAAGGARAE